MFSTCAVDYVLLNNMNAWHGYNTVINPTGNKNDTNSEVRTSLTQSGCLAIVPANFSGL